MKELHSQEVRKLAPENDPLKIGMGWTVEDLEKPQILVESTFEMCIRDSVGIISTFADRSMHSANVNLAGNGCVLTETLSGRMHTAMRTSKIWKNSTQDI